MKTDLLDLMPRLLKHDARYTKEAYVFIQSAVDFSVQHFADELVKTNHLSCQQLAEGIRVFALEQFGVMAKYTLEQWGLKATIDLGHVVFNLIEFDILAGQPEDKLEDFAFLYDFEEAFRSPFADYQAEIDPARIPKIDSL